MITAAAVCNRQTFDRVPVENTRGVIMQKSGSRWGANIVLWDEEGRISGGRVNEAQWRKRFLGERVYSDTSIWMHCIVCYITK